MLDITDKRQTTAMPAALWGRKEKQTNFMAIHSSIEDISLWTTNVKLLGVLEEKSVGFILLSVTTVCNKFHGNPSNACWGGSLKNTHISLMLVLQEKAGVHQQSIQLLTCFSLDQRGAILRAMLLRWINTCRSRLLLQIRYYSFGQTQY